MVYMFCLFRDVLLEQEAQCLKVLGPMVVVPSGIQVLLTLDPMAVSLAFTPLADHVFLVVIAISPMDHIFLMVITIPLADHIFPFMVIGLLLGLG